MDDEIILGVALAAFTFLMIAVFYAVVEVLRDKQEEVKYFNRRFNYKKIDNIYEEFILRNKEDYDTIEQAIKVTIFVVIGSIAIIPILFLYEFLYTPSIAVTLINCAFMYMMLSFFVYSYGIKLPNLLETKNLLFKDSLINYIIHETLDGFNYFPKDEIDEATYLKAGFYERYITYFSEDLMEGDIKGNKVQLAEVETLNVDEDHDNKLPVFHGIFAYVNLKNKVKNNIILTTKDQKVQNKNLVLTTNSTFNNLFNMYSSDQIDTYTFLSDKVLEMLSELNKIFDITIDIKISKKEMFMRFHTGPLFDTLIFSRDERNRVYMFSLICDTITELVTCINNK